MTKACLVWLPYPQLQCYLRQLPQPLFLYNVATIRRRVRDWYQLLFDRCYTGCCLAAADPFLTLTPQLFRGCQIRVERPHETPTSGCRQPFFLHGQCLRLTLLSVQPARVPRDSLVRTELEVSRNRQKLPLVFVVAGQWRHYLRRQRLHQHFLA